VGALALDPDQVDPLQTQGLVEQLVGEDLLPDLDLEIASEVGQSADLVDVEELDWVEDVVLDG
jgi:hypothetical protein